MHHAYRSAIPALLLKGDNNMAFARVRPRHRYKGFKAGEEFEVSQNELNRARGALMCEKEAQAFDKALAEVIALQAHYGEAQLALAVADAKHRAAQAKLDAIGAGE